MNTIKLLNALKKHFSVETDYALAKQIGVSRSYIGDCRKKRRFFSEEMAKNSCETLGIDPAETLLDIHIEKIESPELKKAWKGIANKFAAVASLCFILVFSPFSIDSAQANNSSEYSNNPNNIYYVKLDFLFKIIRYLSLITGLDLLFPKRPIFAS